MSQETFRKSPVPLQEMISFSDSLARQKIQQEILPAEWELFEHLEKWRKDLNFPALKDSVGGFIRFVAQQTRPRNYFEFGSGYGHSAFWLMGLKSLEKIYLTEKRPQLKEIFNSLPWPTTFLSKTQYHFGDALDLLREISHLDMALLDGEKGKYLEVLQLLESKVPSGGVVFIDNAFFKGHFLDQEALLKHKSLQKLSAVYEYLKSGPWQSSFIPVSDGLLWLVKS